MGMERLRGQGFTFIEVMLAVVIVGVAMVALVQALTSATLLNVEAARRTTAANLARNLHEYALSRDVAGLSALDGRSYTTVIGSDGAELAGYDGWQQSASVYKVVPASGIQSNVDLASAASTRIRRLVVQVRYKGNLEYSESWLLAATGM